MASLNDETYKVGEGNAQEKTNQTMDTMKGKKPTVKARDSAEQSKDKWNIYVSATTVAAKQKAYGAMKSARDTAEVGKEMSGDMLKKTGESVKNMAQGAADAVMNTFGMAYEEDDDDEDEDDTNTYKRA